MVKKQSIVCIVAVFSYYKEETKDSGGLQDINWIHETYLKESISKTIESNKFTGYFLYAMDIRFFKLSKVRRRFGQQALTKKLDYLKKLLAL